MERSDFVKLINDNEELRAKNIFKGMDGVLISYINTTDEWIVKFQDDNNWGAYAIAKAKTKDLKYCSPYPKEILSEFLEQINDPDFYTHTELTPPKFKEYDRIMLIKDKPKYNNEGVKTGMIGCVMSSYAIQNKWQVIFSDVNTGDDIADLTVHEDDMELINRNGQ